MESIYSRRSIRKYQPTDVSETLVNQLLRAGMYAPSAGNEKPWHFIVVRNRTLLNQITRIHPHTQMLLEAPLAIVPCVDLRELKYDGDFWEQDMSACTMAILLQGEALGLGTCWCGVHPKKNLLQEISQLLQLPNYMIPFSVIAVGYPDEKREVRERFDAQRVHQDTW
jgi:nitroreductase